MGDRTPCLVEFQIAFRNPTAIFPVTQADQTRGVSRVLDTLFPDRRIRVARPYLNAKIKEPDCFPRKTTQFYRRRSCVLPRPTVIIMANAIRLAETGVRRIDNEE